MENMLLVLKKYSTHFLSSTITRSRFSWVGMENTHTGSMVNYYFGVPWSAIHKERQLTLILVKRFSGPLPSLYLFDN